MTRTVSTADPPRFIERRVDRDWKLVVLFTNGELLINREAETLDAKRETEIGGEAFSDRIVVADKAVSRLHARVRSVAADKWEIRDEGSKHGTFVDGRRIGANWTALENNSLIVIGGALLMLCHEGSVAEGEPLGEMAGDSFAARRLFQQLRHAAKSELTVLLIGPTGVGKELCARAVAKESPRAEGPLVEQSCAAIPTNLVESVLFGHVRGAFTGADRAQEGLFQAADGGTLFLDEIGELPLELQAKLLRVLETKTVRPVGSSAASTPIDVRIVAATNRDLEADVRDGKFREDLYYRLQQILIDVPSLSDRRPDILRIVEQRLDGHVERVSFFMAYALCGHKWPGNIRELVNFIDASIKPEHDKAREKLQDFLGKHVPKEMRSSGDSKLTSTPFSTFVSLLTEHKGNTTRVAQALGCSRRALGRRLEELGIKAENFRGKSTRG